jgi:hypothetical protein
MGDTCYLEIRLHDKDVKRFCEVLEEDDPGDWACAIDRDNEHSKTYTVDEADYGWYDELDNAARAGIIFEGWHGSGGDYGAYRFVSSGHGKVLYAEQTHEGFYVIPVQTLDDICSAVNEGMSRLQIFKAALELAEKHFESD